jgi:Ca2+-binding EF-hand superfamily protein
MVEELINAYMQQKEFEIFKSLDFNMSAPTGSDILFCVLKLGKQNIDFENLYSLVSKLSIRHIYMEGLEEYP